MNTFTDTFKSLVNKVNPPLEAQDVRFRYLQSLRQDIGSLVAVFTMDQQLDLDGLARMAQRLESQQQHCQLPGTTSGIMANVVPAAAVRVGPVENAASSGTAPMELGMASAVNGKIKGKCWYCKKPGHVRAKCLAWRAANKTAKKPGSTGGGNGGNDNKKKSERAQ